MKKHLSDVAEKAIKTESGKPSPWSDRSGVKIIINLGGPAPMPMPMRAAKHNTHKPGHIKKVKRKKGVSGPMENALKEMY